MNQYGAGHVNRYTSDSVGTAFNQNGYGGMAYYTSDTCEYLSGSWVNTACTTDYAFSEIKYVVDAWKNVKAPEAIEARLLTYEELTADLGCINDSCANSSNSWLYNRNILYWTSSSYNNLSIMVWRVAGNGILGSDGGGSIARTVRPVITISKSAL